MMKLPILLFSLLMALFTAVSAAQAQAVSDSDFGRLFSRANERKNLDVLRQNQKLKVVTPQDNPKTEPLAVVAPLELPDPIALKGFVKRSDGTSTLWVNNKAVQEDSIVDNVQIGRLNQQAGSAQTSGDSLNVRVPANGKRILLKAGQVYVPETNQVKEFKILEKEKRLHLEETGVIGGDVAP